MSIGSECKRLAVRGTEGAPVKSTLPSMMRPALGSTIKTEQNRDNRHKGKRKLKPRGVRVGEGMEAQPRKLRKLLYI